MLPISVWTKLNKIEGVELPILSMKQDAKMNRINILFDVKDYRV